MIAVLCGGVGAARLLRALRLVHDPSDVVAIINVGDDVVLHGLTICPDIDTITYTLAGLNNEELGWGLAGETWRVMDELTALGGASWFRLGDRDLATHLYRSQRFREGASKADVTSELARHHGVSEQLIPCTNDDVRTVFDTVDGQMGFQEYFVARRHDVVVRSVHFEGAATAVASPGVLESLNKAERIVIAPSNPLISIDPILAVSSIREHLVDRRDDVVSVSPIIAGTALKGPADRLMSELGLEASCVGVARYYRDIASSIVIDELDRERVSEIEALGVSTHVTSTVMSTNENSERLAKAVLS